MVEDEPDSLAGASLTSAVDFYIWEIWLPRVGMIVSLLGRGHSSTIDYRLSTIDELKYPSTSDHLQQLLYHLLGHLSG